MANPKKSKVIGKRPYAKKSAYWDNRKSSTFTLNEDNSVLPEPIVDSEILQLGTIISIIDNWSDAQKSRNLRFINSKYEEFNY